ncbi:ATP-dependent DNA helicase pfh1 [Frankliniella fusca]|uniref:ATP-dependent DNA helicase n=1 Tax=Frankliniella fusca TaxID=407009 RepID=A0AAE1GVE6_9NEOP|nr:ATP-dependent DNA helicase pfh1 [Frankliniella fusca]
MTAAPPSQPGPSRVSVFLRLGAKQERPVAPQQDEPLPDEIFKRKRTVVKNPAAPAPKEPSAGYSGPTFTEAVLSKSMGVVPHPVFHLPPPQPHTSQLTDDVDMNEVVEDIKAKRAKRFKKSCFAKKLPHSLDNLKSIITVRTSDNVNPVDFHVRAGVIRKALLWLKEHNIYYNDIEISEDNLNRLPEDGNVFDSIQLTFNADTIEDEDEEVEEEVVGERNYSRIQETCVPMIGRPTTKAQAEVVLGWPEISPDCINEFKTPGYVAMAFPTLFPTGQADLRNPREFSISPKKYFQHLLRYHDDRFAKHPRFRYFALNSIMRWTALSNGGIFVRKNSNFKNMNAEQLKEELENDPSLIKKLMFYNSNLQGTRSFWYSKGQELLSMVEQLGLPTLFFTLSAADLHWPDLFKFLSPDEDPQSMSDARRRKLVEQHPAKVDAFFTLRGKTFITEVLRKKFQINDLWYRIEYQHRGSPHIHGVMWLKDAPKFNDLSKSTDEEILQIANYFEQYICTTHPDINCPPAPIHPSRLRLAEIIDIKKDLAELLNRVQRHTKCSEAYCLRKNKTKGGKLECRFKFPVELRDHCQIIISEDRDVEPVTARNDSYLNKYNPYIIQTWRANIDLSPVISKRALVNYLAKYISKSETQSKDMMNIMKELLKITDSEKTAKSVIQRLYIQSCCERDYSAQETCHLIMGLPLLSAGGRDFVNLNFKVLEPNGWVEVTDDEKTPSKSYIEKYMERPCEFEQESLWHMAKKYKLPKVQRHANGFDAIVRVFPKVSEQSKNDSDDYYKQQVMLHIPWRFEEEFLDKYNTSEEAYLSNEQRIRSTDVQCNLENTDPDEEEYEQQNTDEHHITEQFMTSTILGPNQKTKDIDLGLREIDLRFDWHAAASKYDQYGGIPVIKSFIQDKRKEARTDNTVPLMPSVTFTSEQQSVLNLLKLQIQSIQHEQSNTLTFALPQTTIVQGKAGTGKSLLIHAMKSLIYEAFGENSFALIGPTGVSALNIGGSTIHSKLYIHPKTRELLPLKAGALQDFQQKFEKTLFVLIDEYSMIGCGMINKIEKRLREALDQELPYGGLFVYFFGDVQQLAPVGDPAVYSQNQKYVDEINGKLLFNNIDASIVLSQVQRQNNVDFQNLLNNISTGNVQDEDFNILKKRFKTAVSPTERNSFDDAIHLFPTREEIFNHNVKKLRKLNDPVTASPVPVARIPAQHNCPAAALASDTAAEGLESVLYLAVGAKVMLRSNLWTEQACGLVNGAIGHIVDILYDKDASPGEDLPGALVCHFPSYKGPYLNEEKTVVIQPITKTWKDSKGNDLTRIQFPVALSYACTIHKSQGLTLEKAFINIGILKEMAPGLTYTALSRVKTLEGMLLEQISLQRIMSLNKKDYITSRKEWIDLLATRAIDNLDHNT